MSRSLTLIDCFFFFFLFFNKKPGRPLPPRRLLVHGCDQHVQAVSLRLDGWMETEGEAENELKGWERTEKNLDLTTATTRDSAACVGGEEGGRRRAKGAPHRRPLFSLQRQDATSTRERQPSTAAFGRRRARLRSPKTSPQRTDTALSFIRAKGGPRRPLFCPRPEASN